MWNFGMNGLAMGPNYIQKRHYTRHQPAADVRVVPGKKFDNPNFVVNGFSKLASYSDINHQLDILNQSKNDDKNSSSNSSNIIEKIREQCPELVEAPAKQSHDSMCKSARQPSRKRQKSPHKSSKQKQKREMVNDMLDIEKQTQQDPAGLLDTPFNLNEFVITTKNNMNTAISRDKDNSLSSSEDSFVLFENEDGRGSRQISVSESEDSFIIFETNEDCESDICSRCSDTEDEAEDEATDLDDDTTDLDSSYSVIEAKRVRFADDSQLCEVHPMVKWSYAYQAARKGPWEEYARDRERFQRRICDTEPKLKHIFDSDLRNRIYLERFDCGNT